MGAPRAPLFALAALVLLGGIALWVLRGPSAPPTTIVVVLIDTLRQDALGAYGEPRGASPCLDALAAESVCFRNALSTSGWTLPAVGSLLTGTWPTLHGGFGREALLHPIRPEVATAAEVLRDAGFRTTAIANAAFLSPLLHLDRGFDEFDHRYAYNSFVRRADETVDVALDRIQRHRRDRHFVLVHLFDPHLNYDPPAPWTRRFTAGRSSPAPPLDLNGSRGLGGDAAGAAYVRDVHLGELGFVDREVGRLVRGLRDLRLWESCTFVVLSDHGEEFWDHGDFEHGHSLYAELLRIPLILKPPIGTGSFAGIVDAQVRILDVLPTVFELAGVQPPPSFVGESLVSRIAGRERADLFAFAEGLLYGESQLAWSDGRHKIVVDLETGLSPQVELYDLGQDPGERRDRAGESPELAEALGSDLTAFVGRLTDEALTLSRPEPVSLAPEDVATLRSLGYIR
ncbi:MAG: sulfatase [Candidatus Eiseniibacteriota bacterium]